MIYRKTKSPQSTNYIQMYKMPMTGWAGTTPVTPPYDLVIELSHIINSDSDSHIVDV